MIETIRRKGKTVQVRADLGYLPHVRLLCKLTDTGNGYIAKFPSHSSCEQDHYLCMDYAEAEYLRQALTEMMK